MVQEEIDSDGARTLSIEHKREENHGIVVIAEMLGIIDFAEFIDIQKKSISSLNDWKNVKIDTSRNVQLNNQFFDKIKVSFTSENGEGVSEVFHKNMNKKTYFITTTILLDTQKIKDDILMLSEFKNSFVIDEQ